MTRKTNSVRDMAEQLGLTPSAVQRFLRGENVMLETAVKMLRFRDVCPCCAQSLGNKPRRPERESESQLRVRLEFAQSVVPYGMLIRHVRTAGVYLIRGNTLRAEDLEIMVTYRPRSTESLHFSRTMTEILAKFVRVDGKPWPRPRHQR
jgi:hypothetical protein